MSEINPGKGNEFKIINGRKSFAAPIAPPRIETISGGAIQTPTFRIVIPVYERPQVNEAVRYALGSLQTAGTVAELAVVDNSPGTPSLNPLPLNNHPQLTRTVIYQDATHTIGSAKNKGIELLKENQASEPPQWTMFLDSDTYPHPEVFSQLMEIAKRHPEIDVLSSPTVWLKDGATAETLFDVDFVSALDILRCKPEDRLLKRGKRLESGLIEVPAVQGCIESIKTETLDRIGPYNLFFGMHGENIELSARLQDNDGMIVYSMYPSSLHDDRSSVEFSVTRNFPSRERYTLATLIAIYMRNHVFEHPTKEQNFRDLVREK